MSESHEAGEGYTKYVLLPSPWRHCDVGLKKKKKEHGWSGGQAFLNKSLETASTNKLVMTNGSTCIRNATKSLDVYQYREAHSIIKLAHFKKPDFDYLKKNN